MKLLKVLSLTCIVISFILLICGEIYLSYGKGYKSNPKYKSRIVGGGGGMSYMIPVEENNKRYLQYESENANYSDVQRLLQQLCAYYFSNNSNGNDFYPIIDYYGEDETNDMLNVSDPSELLNTFFNKSSYRVGDYPYYTIRATYYNNIGEIEKITIVAHEYEKPITRDINLDIVKAVESPYIVTNQSILIKGISMIIISPIALIIAIILYIIFVTIKLRIHRST